MLKNLFGTEKFTGWHMMGVMTLFFGTIISVNLTLAYFAAQSWTGLVVKNSYVASQHFNEDVAEKKRQAALNWREHSVYQGDTLTVTLTDQNGLPITLDSLTATLGRPAHERQNMVVVLEPVSRGQYAAKVVLGSGVWDLALTAVRDDAVLWTARHRLEGGTR